MVNKPVLVEVDTVSAHYSKMEQTTSAISQAIQMAREEGEEVVVAVCLRCTRDNTFTGSCFMCDRITVDPTGKVSFESIN